MHDIPFSVMAALASLVYALGLFTDNVIGKQWSSVLKQAKTWVIGFVVVLIAAHIQFTEGWTVAGIQFHALTFWSQLLLGLTGAATGNTVFHLGQRLDPTGSGDTPELVRHRGAKKK